MDRNYMNMDTLGLRFSKPQPALYSVSLTEYQQAIDRIAAGLREHGYAAVEARLVPEWDYWMFYDEDGNLLIRVAHELVTRITALYKSWHDRELDAQIYALMKEPKREW